jgi:hypothetical protein
MASTFIIKSGGEVLSFARYEDVLEMDSRVFEANEIGTLTERQETVEDMLIRSTDRLVQKLKASAWWRVYNNVAISGSLGIGITIPTPDKTKLQRRADWTELCVYHTLKEYLYPKIADFGVEGSAEVQKITFYEAKFNALWDELMASGDFYDSDNDGTVEESEKMLKPKVYRRSRGYRSISGVR